MLLLQLETESKREVSVADGRKMNVPYVGPIRVSFGKRFCFVGALVLEAMRSCLVQCQWKIRIW